MAVAKTVQDYLADHNVEYRTELHPVTYSSSETAEAGHVSGDRIAKGVVLSKGDGFLVAVLPASYHVRIGVLRTVLDESVELATEEEIQNLFPDCVKGAIPAVAAAYGLDVIVDENLLDQTDVYFEGGDHQNLVHVSGEDFRRLFSDIRHAQIGVHDG